jgi:PEP-CTERM motif
MKLNFILALALSAAVATPAFAGTTIFSGNTVGGPTYNRPLSGRPPTNLSGVGTAVRYAVNPFTVSVSGAYNFVNSTTYDSYLGIHANLFSPSNGLLNAIAYDDDSGPGADSAITGLNLLAGTSYFAINSGFSNNDFGAFTLTVTGPGDITGGNVLGAVPEPGIWGLMIVGFGLIGAALRRQTGRVAFAG